MSPEERRHRHRILKNAPHHRRPKNRRPNTKLTGERSEAAFLARVMYMNFGVSKPWGDSRKYDFILDNGELPLIRIQVKCTESFRADAYETRATYTRGNKHIPYSKKDCDFIAAHVVPLDLWYIVPVEVSEPAPMLRFYPHRKPKYERLECYKEAWHLILPKKGVVNGKIELQACADEDQSEPDDLEILDPNTHAILNPQISAAIDPSAVDANKIVIPSEGDDPQSRSAPQSRACPEQAKRAEGDLVFPEDPYGVGSPARDQGQQEKCSAGAPARERSAQKPPSASISSHPDPLHPFLQALRANIPATTLDPNLSPFELPKVRILAHRQGKHLLPNPTDA